MAFGWSVGDIIAGINLLVISINALDDSYGSSREYRAIKTSLEQVSATLAGLNRLHIEDAAEQQALQICACKCGETIYQFINKIERFEPSLSSRRSVWHLKATLRKLQWGLYTTKDLQRFHTQLLADLACLNLTLITVLGSISKAQELRNRSTLMRIESKVDQTLGLHCALIQALQQCFSNFRTMFLAMLMYNVQLVVYLGFKRSIDQSLEEIPFYIDDPNRRILRFLPSTIRDWEDFDISLKMRFKREAGLQKILAGEYVIQDSLRNTDISTLMPIERVLLPGKRLTMSMIFELPLIEQQCPRCSGLRSSRNGSAMKCNGCQLEFSISKDTAVKDGRNEARFESPTNGARNGIALGTYIGSNDMFEMQRTRAADTIHDFTRVRIIEQSLASGAEYVENASYDDDHEADTDAQQSKLRFASLPILDNRHALLPGMDILLKNFVHITVKMPQINGIMLLDLFTEHDLGQYGQVYNSVISYEKRGFESFPVAVHILFARAEDAFNCILGIGIYSRSRGGTICPENPIIKRCPSFSRDRECQNCKCRLFHNPNEPALELFARFTQS